MSMIVNHDVTSLMGQRIMMKNSLAMKRSLEKLSTGLRTKIADVDNTAGLAISETMRSRIYGMEKALYNSEDGVSMIQTATGALEGTQSMLMRMRELSVQAANDTLTQQDRSYIQTEINEIRDEITRIGATTQFNRKRILSGDNAVLWSSTNNNVKAIVNGGLRSIDEYGQKYAVDGNFKITVKADAGKAQTQKTDIFRIKHDDTVVNKSVNVREGVSDVSVTNTPSGSYTITRQEVAEAGAVLTGSYGIGGSQSTTTTSITLQAVNSPVTKITVQTSDGVEIWSTSGGDIFGSGSNTISGAAQASYFAGTGGAADSEGYIFSGVQDEIIAAARSKGITLNSDAFTSGSDTVNFSAITTNNGTAPGIQIIYEGGGDGTAPLVNSTAFGTTPQTIDPAGVFEVQAGENLLDNASVLFEVTGVNSTNGTVTLKATANKLSQNGVSSTAIQEDIVLSEGGNAVNLSKLFGGTEDAPSLTIGLNANMLSAVGEGAKFVYSVTPNVDTAGGNNSAIDINISGTMNSSWPDKWDGGPYGGNTIDYVLNGDNVSNSELHFRTFNLNSKTGVASEGDIKLTTNSSFRTSPGGGLTDETIGDVLASFDASYVGKVATGSTKLRDIDKFWDGQGKFILDQPKELTLTQGDGTQAKIMIYGEDTVDDLVNKLNNAVAVGLGQAKYVDDASKFVTFVNGETSGTEAVAGTMIVRSALTGRKGEITLSGNEDILTAISLNTVQEARETSYNVSVKNAHTDEMIADNVKITGNVLVGVIHKNIDVEFDPMLGIQAAWNSSTKNFDLLDTTTGKGTEVTLHLADNTTVFQTGASEGEDVMISIGDMRAHALGLDGVNVMTRESAAISTGIIDKAIDKVSMQQAKLGAAQNRLEHHIGNLTDETEALIGANSRIRDTDYMKEILEYTKMQILMQSNAAMLAQANQAQQSVLVFFR